MKLHFQVLVGVLFASMLLGTADTAHATSFPLSLWIGTDNGGSPVLNTDTSGNILRSVAVESVGFAIDVASDTIYFGTLGSGDITPRNLTTLTPGSPITGPNAGQEDMTFDGSMIWRANLANGSVDRINPANGLTVGSFNPGFAPLGVAWDGTGLWVSEFTTGGLVKRFNPAGTATGEVFNFAQDLLTGGLAFDTTDDTLWIGTFGEVFHYTTTGTQLGSFNVTAQGGTFVDGLEFQDAVPEPSTLTLVGLGLLVAARRLPLRRTKK